MSLDACLTRVNELRSLVQPPVVARPSGTADFASVLSSAVGPIPSSPPAVSAAALAPRDANAAATGVERWSTDFVRAEARYGLPTGLLRSVAIAESGGDPTAVSPAGARGLMQIMPATARGLGVDPLDPSAAIDGAARLLKGHLDRFGSVELAVAAYNAGGGAVERHHGVPPYAETRAYVRRVLGLLGQR